MRYRTILGLAGLATVAAAGAMFAEAPSATAQTPAASPAPAPASSKMLTLPGGMDPAVLHAQVILDKLGFGPGLLDGRDSPSFARALRGFQTSRGLGVTGDLDAPTLRALYPYRAWRPIKMIALTEGMLRGPFLNPTPEDYADQAKLPGVPYRSPLEKLAEMFHTSPQVLVTLNSRETPLRVGQEVVFPNALPTERNYAIDDATWRSTVAYLNVGSNQPVADRVVVDESEGALKVYDAEDRLVAQFGATMGSSQFPLPIGEWTIKGTAFNPDWSYDPDLIAGSAPDAEEAVVPPGPNNPVGVVWLDLSKEHYGIHGTPEPQNIGKTESNGCIRLTNWDAARLALMVKPGTRAIFQR
ncbi:L,D-transpeptidase family protein [Sphingomonas baiyangensis]|uniref:Murein L,D-transpeptidase n=1 Tax=Sphingomonas baiyangensis TaxID=2572576 RepID=A0A4U1L1Y3_9SPHN|nr:L,D-transpeptidase [Sphingomonas baiyangensis]TKD50849.1 murein L,D-transpeptidase [Sphingomonas baiyangensis]